MPPYRVSIDLDFELADDVEARERLEPEVRGLAHQLDLRYADGVKRTIKIRRLLRRSTAEVVGEVAGGMSSPGDQQCAAAVPVTGRTTLGVYC